MGKVLILKAVILPLFLYVGALFVPSRSVLSQLDRAIFYFLWGSKWEHVRREVVKRTSLKGGRGVPEVGTVLMCKFVFVI